LSLPLLISYLNGSRVGFQRFQAGETYDIISQRPQSLSGKGQDIGPLQEMLDA
jgi:hypothetical protein